MEKVLIVLIVFMVGYTIGDSNTITYSVDLPEEINQAEVGDTLYCYAKDHGRIYLGFKKY